jgi:hypothetical protein
MEVQAEVVYDVILCTYVVLSLGSVRKTAIGGAGFGRDSIGTTGSPSDDRTTLN